MITFYYEISNLIDRAQIETLLQVKRMEDRDGIPELEELAIADEDEPYVRKLIEDVSNEIYSTLSPYSRLLAELETPLEGFEFESTYTAPDDSTVADCVIFRIIEPLNFDDVVMLPLENSIKNTIIHYVVSEFLKRNAADPGDHVNLYEKAKDSILKYINRRTKLKRTYKLY